AFDVRGPRSEARDWLVYILRCRDGTLYTGVTTDLDRRLAAHVAGRGARYTRGRGPFAVVHVEGAGPRGAALRRRHALEELSRAAKRALFDGISRSPAGRAAARARARGSAARSRR